MKLPEPLSHIDQIAPYKKSDPIATIAKQAGIKLEEVTYIASNENPSTPSHHVTTAIAQLHTLNRYPDGSDLVAAIAKYHNLQPEHVVLGNGSNDVLDLIARTYLGPDCQAISSQYGFAIYRLLTQIAGAENCIVPAHNYGHDLTAMTKAVTNKTKVIWIANPNNPTGTFADWKAVQSLLDTVPPSVLVVLDQAYYEYLDKQDTAPTVEWLDTYPNLIITRTFSKAYGLPGLRIGYGLASPAIVALLNRVRQPFNVNAVAIVAAVAALQDNAFVTTTAQQNLQERSMLESSLQALNINYVPSFGNFVLAEFADAEMANTALQNAGILVRPVKEYGLPNHLRISIGNPSENKKLLQVLSNFLSNN